MRRSPATSAAERIPADLPPGPRSPSPEPGWRASRQLLRGPLRTLVAGQCLGQGADGLAQIAFAQFVVFEAGKGATPARIATLLAATLLPFSLVGPFAGVLIDRWSRRRVLVVLSYVRAALMLAAVVAVGSRSRVGAFAGVLLMLSASRFVLAAKGAALPRTVRRNELVTSNAISAVAGMTATFVGAVGGAGFVGRSPEAGFAAAALLYVGAAVAFDRLPDVGGGGRQAVLAGVRQAMSDVWEGLRAVVRTPDIGRPLAGVWLHRLLLGAGFVTVVLIADSRFHLRIAGYGLALAVTGVAAFAGSVAAPWCARRWQSRALLPALFVPPAIAGYAAGISPNLVVLVAGLAVTAFSFQLLKVLVDATVGGVSPDGVRGRVFSVYDVLYNVAFVMAGLLVIPLWDAAHARQLLWLVAAGFVVGWVAYSRLTRTWPFAAERTHERGGRRWLGRVAAFAAGGAMVFAFPAVAWWWLAWFGLVPLLLLIRSAPSAREGAMRGWWGGAGFVVATQYWLLPVAGPALPLLGAALGALWLPWGWAAHRLMSGRPSPSALAGALVVLPAGWVAVEAVRSWQSLGGPWALLGSSQWNQPALLASAALGGVWLTGFLVVLVNVAVVVVLIAARAGMQSLAIAAAVTAVAAAAIGPAWTTLRPTSPSTGTVRVAVVQPGLLGSDASRLSRELALSSAVAHQHPGLIVWGESGIGYDLASRPDVTSLLVGLVRRSGADLLANVDAQRSGTGIYKSSVLITASGLAASYDKTRLVPFGEYIPVRDLLGWVAHVSKAAKANRHRGHGPVVMHTGTVTVGPLICFESAFPDMSRREVILGAQLIVYQTASSTFQGSWAQAQHASLAAVRAVETGRPVVHAALTGTSAVFDSTGHRLLWLDAGRSGAVIATVTLTAAHTPYDVAGDWVLSLSAAIIGTALIVAALAGSAVTRPFDLLSTPPGRAAE